MPWEIREHGPGHGGEKEPKQGMSGLECATNCKAAHFWEVTRGSEGPEVADRSPRPAGGHTAARAILSLPCNPDGEEDLSHCI